MPKDEQFSDVKEKGFQAKALLTVLRSVIPTIENKIEDAELSFPYFTAIDSLFDVGLVVPGLESIVRHLLPERLIKIKDKIENAFLRFERPDLFKSTLLLLYLIILINAIFLFYNLFPICRNNLTMYRCGRGQICLV